MSFIKDTAVDEETPCWFEIWLLKVKDQVKSKSSTIQKFTMLKFTTKMTFFSMMVVIGRNFVLKYFVIFIIFN